MTEQSDPCLCWWHMSFYYAGYVIKWCPTKALYFFLFVFFFFYFHHCENTHFTGETLSATNHKHVQERYSIDYLLLSCTVQLTVLVTDMGGIALTLRVPSPNV